jgi:hypothetical protein
LSVETVRQHLAEGDWDDREIALLLYPRRVADTCWEDPTLARKLNIKLPTRRSEAARQKFTKQLVNAGCPDLAHKLESALAGRAETFADFWDDLESGVHDLLAISLPLSPERVIDRCTANESMSEAHGLRQFFWIQHPSETWRRREAPEVEIKNEVARRGANRRQEDKV